MTAASSYAKSLYSAVSGSTFTPSSTSSTIVNGSYSWETWFRIFFEQWLCTQNKIHTSHDSQFDALLFQKATDTYLLLVAFVHNHRIQLSVAF